MKLINRLLKFFNLRIYHLSHFEKKVENLAWLRNPKRSNKKVKFIQIGANDGIRFDNLFFTVTDHKWSGLVIEPMKDYFERLKLNYRDNPEVTPLNLAIHPTKKFIQIYKVNRKKIHLYRHWVSGIASLDINHLIKHGVNPKDISEEKVKCQKLMQVINYHSFYDVDLLQIDTEGFDAEIFKQLDFKKCNPSIIKLEWNHMSNTDKLIVKTILSNNGYKFKIEKGGSDLTAWLKKII